jgi:hypothetical protein
MKPPVLGGFLRLLTKPVGGGVKYEYKLKGLYL